MFFLSIPAACHLETGDALAMKLRETGFKGVTVKDLSQELTKILAEQGDQDNGCPDDNYKVMWREARSLHTKSRLGTVVVCVGNTVCTVFSSPLFVYHVKLCAVCIMWRVGTSFFF